MHFLLHENIFITLQYSGDILGIFEKILKYLKFLKFMECSSNILETLLYDYWNLQKKKKHLFSSSIHYYTTIINAMCTTFFYAKATVFYLSEYLVERVVSAASNVNYWEGNWFVFIYFITKNYFLVTIVTFWAFNSFQFFNL